MAANPRIKLPESAKIGEVIEVKSLITHIMETGNRHDKYGKLIPRDIINLFVAKYAGQEVFRAEFGTGISANPDARAGTGHVRVFMDRRSRRHDSSDRAASAHVSEALNPVRSCQQKNNARARTRVNSQKDPVCAEPFEPF